MQPQNTQQNPYGPSMDYGNGFGDENRYGNMYAQQLPSKKKIIVALVLGVLGIVALIVFFWWMGNSTLSISVANTAGGSGEYTYALTDARGKSTAIRTTSGQVTRTVRKGDYQVLVRRGSTSYLTFVSTKGFLQTTAVSATMKSEAGRKFVGTKPGPCMYYVGTTLLSSTCLSSYEALQVHQPATPNSPPILGSIDAYNFYGPLEGIINTKFGAVALTQQSNSEDEARGHYAAQLLDTLTTVNRTRLPGLNADTRYMLAPYKEGFIAYDDAATNISYFSSLSAKPQQVKVTPPADKQYSAYLVSTNGTGLVVAYGNIPADSGDASENKNFKSIVSVIEGGRQQSFPIASQLTSALTCGTRKLCTVSGKQLKVYDISSGKALPVFSLADIQTIMSTPGGLVAISSTDAMVLDVDSKTGYSSYSFGNYSYCGSNTAPGGLVLCVRKDNLVFAALYIDQTGSPNDNIDKKVLSFAQKAGSDVSFVSPYGNLIFVIPNYGQTEYDPVLGLDGYNPATRTRVNAKVNSLAKSTGLDTPPYQVINSGF